MPAFELQGADGKSYDVEAPDMASAVAAFKKFQGGSASQGEVADAAKSLGSGAVRGAAGILGIGGDISKALGAAVDKIEKSGYKIDREALYSSMPSWLRQYHQPEQTLSGLVTGQQKQRPVIGSQEIMGAIDRATGLPITSYEPKTAVGTYARTVGEFAPAALMGPGGIARNLITQAAIPGVASEFAGQIPGIKGTAAEPWVRGATAITTGAGASVLSRPRSAEQAIRSGLPENVDPRIVTQAEQLINDATARGVTLTWPEAIERVAPGQGTGLLNQQRLLESARQTAGDLAPMFAERPAQIEQAARAEFGQIAPRPATPATIGPAAGREAEGIVNDVRTAINQHTEPFYQQAAQVRLTPQEMAQVRALPGFEEARAAVRGDPQLNRHVANLPDDSVGFLNEVKKYLDQAAENAAAPVNQQRNMQRAAGYGQDARTARQIGVNASQDYEIALAVQERNRRQFLEPLLQGPIGRLADKDITTRKAIDALFPVGRAALAGGEEAVGDAVRALAARNPTAARDLVRAHVESVFDQATRRLQAGDNQWGGGTFAAALVGHPQEAANLQAAISALGQNGAQVWQGFNRFLEIVEATGTRQRIGSRTAFNAEDIKAMSEGRVMSEVGKVGVAPQRLLTALGDVWGRWQLGRNLGELAQILTDPASGNLLRAIASRPTGSREALSIASRLVLNILSNKESKDRGEAVPKPH